MLDPSLKKTSKSQLVSRYTDKAIQMTPGTRGVHRDGGG